MPADMVGAPTGKQCSTTEHENGESTDPVFKKPESFRVSLLATADGSTPLLVPLLHHGTAASSTQLAVAAPSVATASTLTVSLEQSLSVTGIVPAPAVDAMLEDKGTAAAPILELEPDTKTDGVLRLYEATRAASSYPSAPKSCSERTDGEIYYNDRTQRPQRWHFKKKAFVCVCDLTPGLQCVGNQQMYRCKMLNPVRVHQGSRDQSASVSSTLVSPGLPPRNIQIAGDASAIMTRPQNLPEMQMPTSERTSVHAPLPGSTSRQGVAGDAGSAPTNKMSKRDRERQRNKNRQRMRLAAAEASVSTATKPDAEGAAGVPMGGAAGAPKSVAASAPSHAFTPKRKRDRERERNRNRQRIRTAAAVAPEATSEGAAGMTSSAAATSATASTTVVPGRKRDRERDRNRRRMRVAAVAAAKAEAEGAAGMRESEKKTSSGGSSKKKCFTCSWCSKSFTHAPAHFQHERAHRQHDGVDAAAAAAMPSTTVAPVRKRDLERERNRRRMRVAAAAAAKAEAGGATGMSVGGVAAAATPSSTVAPKRRRDRERERNKNRQRLRVAAAAASVSAHMKAEGAAGKEVMPVVADPMVPMEYGTLRNSVSCAECRRRKQRCLCGEKVVVAPGPDPEPDPNLAPKGMGVQYSATMVKAACALCRQRKKRCVHVFLGAGSHQTQGIVASGVLATNNRIRKRDRERERRRNLKWLREAAAAKVEIKAEVEDTAGMPMDAAAAATATSPTAAPVRKRDRDRNRKRDRERERNRRSQRMRIAAREAAEAEAEGTAGMPMAADAAASVSEHAKVVANGAAGSISMPMGGAAAAPSPTVGPVRKRNRDRDFERDRKRWREGGDAKPPLAGGSTRFTPCDFCRRRRIRCVHFDAAAGAGIAAVDSGSEQQGIVKSNEATRASKRLPEQIAAVAHAHLSPQKKPRLAGGGCEDQEHAKSFVVSRTPAYATDADGARLVPCDDCRRRKRQCRCTINMLGGGQENAACNDARSSSGGKGCVSSGDGVGGGFETEQKGVTGVSCKEREAVNWLMEFAQLAQVRRADESVCIYYCVLYNCIVCATIVLCVPL